MAATAIEVIPAGNQLYEVEVRDDEGSSRHQVALPDELLDRLDTDGVAASDLVFAAVGFLTSREGGRADLDDEIDLAEAAEGYEGFVERVFDLARQRTLHGIDGGGEQDEPPSGDQRLLREVREEQADGRASDPDPRL